MQTLVIGSAGFIGKSLVQRLSEHGIPTRWMVASRAKAPALPGVEVLEGDLYREEDLAQAMHGVTHVVPLVSILRERPGQRFEHVHVESTRKILAEAQRQNVAKIVLTSALGASYRASSRYLSTKAEAEQLVKASGIPFVILRPAVIFGRGDEFTRMLTDLIINMPVTPVVGAGRNLYQPLYVEDFTECLFQAVVKDDVVNQTICLAGSDRLTFESMLQALTQALGTDRFRIHVPAQAVEWLLPWVSRALPDLPVTPDQLFLLTHNQTCDNTEMRRCFGVEPRGFRQQIGTLIRPLREPSLPRR
ncbi:3 beta-hydroxysteroid dehydrogenase/Delta 5--_4-isomerase [compost metagenome]